MSKSKSAKAAWRYTMLTAGGVVIQVGKLGPIEGHVRAGYRLDDIGIPSPPGCGLYLWLDLGSTISTGGECPDDAEPLWRGEWVSLDARHLAHLASGRVKFGGAPSLVERERNAALARASDLSMDLWISEREATDQRQFVVDMLPLLDDIVPGRVQDVGVPQAVSEAIAEVERLRGEQRPATVVTEKAATAVKPKRKRTDNPDNPTVISAREAAKLLGVHHTTLYENARAGTVPCRLVGRRFLFVRETLIEWMRAGVDDHTKV